MRGDKKNKNMNQTNNTPEAAPVAGHQRWDDEAAFSFPFHVEDLGENRFAVADKNNRLTGMEFETRRECGRCCEVINTSVSDKANNQQGLALAQSNRRLERVYWLVEGHADGSPDATQLEKLCNQIVGIVWPLPV